MSWQTDAQDEVQMQVIGRVGCITLHRPRALNALSLPMIRTLTQGLLAWRDDPAVLAVAMRGSSRVKAAAGGQPVVSIAHTPAAQGGTADANPAGGGDASAGASASASASASAPQGVQSAHRPQPAAQPVARSGGEVPAQPAQATQAAQADPAHPFAPDVQPFGAFCAGGDIRFFHTAALAGDPALEDFFTEEYTLNHLIHTYPKPTVAFMDGIVMGGGMGLAQGAKHRIATERTQMAMPETNIGLFPDVGGGYFLSRCPGAWGEYLGLTGEVIGGAQAVAVGLADGVVRSGALPALWAALTAADWATPETASAGLAALVARWCAMENEAGCAGESGVLRPFDAEVNAVFSLGTVGDIVQALAQRADSIEPRLANATWAAHTLATLRQRSPLMLHVVLAHIRRARHLNLADTLRLERDLVRHCFHRPDGAASETVEGIRALVVDKDRTPRWQPPRIEDVDANVVQGLFNSPWPAHAHPLRGLL